MTQAPRPLPVPNAPALLWKRLPLLEWIAMNPPAWASQVIRSWDDAIEPSCGVFTLQFLQRTRRSLRSIDVRQIVGQSAHYAGRTWLDPILDGDARGKMLTAIRRADAQPWYYFAPAHRDRMRLVSFDGEQWYAQSGVHRAIVAKFLHAYYESETGFHPRLHSVPTLQHVIDQPTLAAYLALDALIRSRALPISVSVTAGARCVAQSTDEEDVFDPPRIVVRDHRFDDRQEAAPRAMTPRAFRLYAHWVAASGGVVRPRDRMREAVHRVLYRAGRAGADGES